MTKDVKEYEMSCIGCNASRAVNSTPPMTIREIPERPWQHLSADYKGPIGGQYYFHVLIDNYTRWPEVVMIKSTGFRKLEGKMEETFAVHGVPDTITHDNGPCYNSSEWRRFAGKWGFKIRPCTPEHTQANSIAERFMQVLVKVVHTAIAMGQDPKVEVRRMLLNYRNTPHALTGKTPAELMIGRQIKTRIPTVMKRANRKKIRRQENTMKRSTIDGRRNIIKGST